MTNVLFGMHAQRPIRDWLKYVTDTAVYKTVGDFESCRDFKAVCPNGRTVVRQWADNVNQDRWLQMAGESEVKANEAANEFLDLWLDSLIANQEWIDFAESLNEQYPTHAPEKLRQSVEFDRAWIRVLGKKCPGVKPLVFNAAVGNPDHDEYGALLDLARECEAVGGAFGLHCYWPVVNKVSLVTSPSHGRNLHMKWNTIDHYLVGQGIHVNWLLTETGPIGSGVTDPNNHYYGYSLLPNDGWRDNNVWNGQLGGYELDLVCMDGLITKTVAYNEGRFFGYVLFTSGDTGEWDKFELRTYEWKYLAELASERELPVPDNSNGDDNMTDVALEPGFPVYNQRDPRWASDILGFSSLSFGSYGCAVTSAAMVASALTNSEITPKWLNAKLKEIDGFEQAMLRWFKVAEAVGGGLEYVAGQDWVYIAADIPALLTALEAGPAIIQVDYKPSTVTPDSHFVVAYAKAGNDDLWIADPYYGDCVKLLGCGRYSLANWDLARAVYGMRVYASDTEYEPEPEPEKQIYAILYFDGTWEIPE